jgi:hypothetical protein
MFKSVKTMRSTLQGTRHEQSSTHLAANPTTWVEFGCLQLEGTL